MLLADTYNRAMTSAQATRAGAALGLDLFGRHVGWLHMAAVGEYPPAQLLLAQETDSAAYENMPDTALAWYQAAAEHDNPAALAAIGTAYGAGRIPVARLYDFRNWLSHLAHPTKAFRQMARSLAMPAGTIARPPDGKSMPLHLES